MPDVYPVKAPAKSAPAFGWWVRAWCSVRDFDTPQNRRLLVACAAMLGLFVYYVFIATSGTFSEPKKSMVYVTNYYDLLVQGFQKGHLYVPVEPNPLLYEHGNPFYTARWTLWLWDASLFDRRYFMYWGPVPALCMLAYKWLTGFAGEIVDQWPSLLFMMGRLLGGGFLIYRYASLARTRQPAWLVGLGILVFGLANPVPFVLARACVWEASTTGAQCFGFLALWAGFEAMVKPERRMRYLIIAGTLFGLAIGSRITVVVTFPAVFLITVGLLWLDGGRKWWPALKWGLALGTPVALALFGLGLYNYLRFGSFTETGITYQATLQKFFTKPAYVLPNLFSYAFATPDWSCQFPFVEAPRPRSVWSGMRIPPGYATFEPVTGLFTGSTFSLFLWIWPLMGLWMVGRYASGGARRVRPAIPMHELWLALVALAFILACIPGLGLWEAAMRYLMDPVGGATLAAIVGAFWMLRRTGHGLVRPWLFWSVRGGVAVLAAYTILVGVLLAFTPYDKRFENANPALMSSLKKQLSFCPKTAGRTNP